MRGCCQTGGHGKTWKRYVDPQGPNSDRLYHGLVWVPGATSGLVRLQGVIGKTFVVASDAARAAQFAGQSASAVPGAQGSLVFFSDARALANAVAAKRGQGVAAQIFTSALGALSGSAHTETSGITAHLKLQIK